MKRTFLLLVAVVSFAQVCFGSNLLRAGPVTDKIILLHFDDGYIDYHGYHQSNDDDRTVANPLDVKKAARSGSYTIISKDDAEYQKGLHPVSVGRKSKGMDYSRKCKWNGKQCDNDIVFEHWIYLELPAPMKRGKTYTVKLTGLAENKNDAAITFDEFSTRSEAVHVNQLGYIPAAGQKFAYVSQWMGDAGPLSLDDYADTPFHIVRTADGSVAFSGKMKLRKDLETGGPDTWQKEGPFSNFIGADLWQCDFSQFKTPGKYVVAVERIGCSFAFRIDPDVYRRAFYTSCRGLYHERAGIALEKPYTEWTRKRDHHPADGVKIWHSSMRYLDCNQESCMDQVKKNRVRLLDNIWGWYHDAGDWDGYPTHIIIPRYLLTVYELKPAGFTDGELNIPESGNTIPDIIDEANWLINYFRRAKGPTGGVCGARVHAVGPRPDGKEANGFGSYEDTRQWYAYGEDPRTSYRYTSLAAQLAYCLDISAGGKHKDSPGWLAEAENAYNWAGKNLRKGDEPKIIGARMVADAWLYKYTSDDKYQRQFKADHKTVGKIKPNSASPTEKQWAVWAYVTTKSKNIDTDFKDALTAEAISWADELNVIPASKRGFRAGWSWYVPTVIGFNTTPHVIESVIAYVLTGKQKYLDVVETTCDYMLGGNGLNMCQVTGLGYRYPKQFLHIDSWYDDKEQFIPGISLYSVLAPKQPIDKWVGPWDQRMVWDKGVYPRYDKWPMHAGYVDNRYCVMGNEFTVHQNVAPAAAVYGWLCSEKQ